MRIALEWDTTGRSQLLHPGLRTGGGHPHPAPGAHPPDNRRLIHRAFHQLPELAQCLLWHTVVEGEDISRPAALVGLDPERAGHELDRALKLLRTSCVQAHLTLAADEQCRRYNRLIEAVTRTSHLHHLPDLRRHSRQCSHCRHALDQLDHSRQQLPLLLAEGVLDWRADDYLAARRNGTADALRPAGRRPSTGGPVPKKRDARLWNRSMGWAVATVILLAAAGTTILASLTGGTATRAAGEPGPSSAAPRVAPPPSSAAPRSAPSPDTPSGVHRTQPSTASSRLPQLPSTAPPGDTAVHASAPAPPLTCRSDSKPEAAARRHTVARQYDEPRSRHCDLPDNDRDRADAGPRHDPDRCEPRQGEDRRHEHDPCDRQPDDGDQQGPGEHDGRDREHGRHQHADHRRQWSHHPHLSDSPPYADGTAPAQNDESAR
ncbi:hypothetical protein [Streptomyces sp. NPDC088760]|uniref:hypothetical protein n=1 Tax=Streptomyces sp. NPDC088760 TaxID=3365890 RepID=UPI0037F28E5A